MGALARRPDFIALLTAVLAVGSGGCAATRGSPNRSIDRRALLARIETDPQFQADALLDAYYRARTEDERVRIRNRLIDAGLISINSYYSLFVDELASQRKAFEAGGDIASIATDIAATLIAPPGTKSILAAVSGGITAAQASVAESYFYDQTLLALRKQMDAERRVVIVDLVRGSRLSTRAYSFGSALDDLERFYRAGTIEGALSAVQQQAAEQQRDANDLIRSIQDQLDRVGEYHSQAEAWIAHHGLDAGRSAMVAWYDGLQRGTSDAPDIGFVVARSALAETLVARHRVPEVLALLGEVGGTERERAQALLESGSDDDIGEFITEFAGQLDLRLWLSSRIDAEGIARVAASEALANPLGIGGS